MNNNFNNNNNQNDKVPSLRLIERGLLVSIGSFLLLLRYYRFLQTDAIMLIKIVEIPNMIVFLGTAIMGISMLVRGIKLFKYSSDELINDSSEIMSKIAIPIMVFGAFCWLIKVFFIFNYISLRTFPKISFLLFVISLIFLIISNWFLLKLTRKMLKNVKVRQIN